MYPRNVFGMSYFDLWLIKCLVAYLSTENAERNSLDEFSELLQEKAFIKECPTIGGIKTLIAKRGFIARNFDEARAKNEWEIEREENRNFSSILFVLYKIVKNKKRFFQCSTHTHLHTHTQLHMYTYIHTYIQRLKTWNRK